MITKTKLDLLNQFSQWKIESTDGKNTDIIELFHNIQIHIHNISDCLTITQTHLIILNRLFKDAIKLLHNILSLKNYKVSVDKYNSVTSLFIFIDLMYMLLFGERPSDDNKLITKMKVEERVKELYNKWKNQN